MPPPTYRQCVRYVLSEIAKASETSIELEALLLRVRTSVQRTFGPRFPALVQEALNREAKSRYLTQRHEHTGHVVYLTASGVRFFKEWGICPLLTPDDPRLKKLSIKKIEEQTQHLKDVLTRLQGVLREFSPDDHELPPESFPDIIQALVHRLDDLREENTRLHQDIAAECQAQRLLRKYIRALDH